MAFIFILFFTLLALLLLIGVVVDDAIVVLENIFRHREELDPDPVSAAINGSQEVAFAVFAATLSLVCIFAPVIFMSGIIGQFFRSFAVVVTFGVLVSLFVSLTLTPMLCSRFLKVKEKGMHLGRVHHWIEARFAKLDAFYVRVLAWALGPRWKVVFATLIAVGSSVFFFSAVGKTFEDEVRGQLPEVRRAQRQARAGPLLTALRTWLEELLRRVSAKSEIAQAIGYSLARWTALTRYVDDGRLEIDNNAAERALRGVALGRNNAKSAFMQSTQRPSRRIPRRQAVRPAEDASHNHSDRRNSKSALGGR